MSVVLQNLKQNLFTSWNALIKTSLTGQTSEKNYGLGGPGTGQSVNEPICKKVGQSVCKTVSQLVT